jgi:hypothetical protein
MDRSHRIAAKSAARIITKTLIKIRKWIALRRQRRASSKVWDASTGDEVDFLLCR